MKREEGKEGKEEEVERTALIRVQMCLRWEGRVRRGGRRRGIEGRGGKGNRQ